MGKWVIRTAESVVLTLCPPGPVERKTSMRRSFALIWMSTSSASGSTATVTVEVWIRPLASVAGTRCTRWTPLSNLSRLYAPRPSTVQIASFIPPIPVALPAIISTRQRCVSAYRSVHAEQLGGEQAGLFPARAGPDLQDDVPLVGGILGEQHELERRLQRRPPLFELRQLRRRQLAHLRVDGLLQQAARALQLLEQLLEAVILLHRRIQLGVEFGRSLILRRIRQHGRVGEPLHDLPVAALDGIQLVDQCGHRNLVESDDRSGPTRPGDRTSDAAATRNDGTATRAGPGSAGGGLVVMPAGGRVMVSVQVERHPGGGPPLGCPDRQTPHPSAAQAAGGVMAVEDVRLMGNIPLPVRPGAGPGAGRLGDPARPLSKHN